MKIPKEGPVLVKFSANWCKPCRDLAPKIEELRDENPDVDIIDIDMDKDENKELAKEYGIRGVPTVLFIKDGQIKSSIVGNHAKESYQENIDSLLEE